jgi:hypothetical protein
MKEHPEVNYIRFKYKEYEANPQICGENVTQFPVISGHSKNLNDTVEDGNIYKTSKYSDNNHLVRFDWYLNSVIAPLGNFKRFPENPMMYKAERKCEDFGLFTYGHLNGRMALYEAPVLRNLDGRKTTSNITGEHGQ